MRKRTYNRIFILLITFLLQQIENNEGALSATAFVIKVSTRTPLLHRRVEEIQHYHSNRKKNTKLHDLSEWRDQFFEVPTEVDQLLLADYNQVNDDEPIREVCVLPFPLDDVLLQGETKELCLYEERFHQLFERSTNCHNSVVAMGLLAPPAGILQNMPLCEIENYRVMQGKTEFGTDFSILCTIRVVGRASLLYIQDEDNNIEYLRGWCTEISDDINYDDDDRDPMKVCNTIADKIEELVTEIQTIEDRLLTGELSMKNRKSTIDRDDFVSEATMKRRILEAELEADNDDEEDDEEEDEEEMSRRSRLTNAFNIAKATDYQGYTLSNSDTSTTRSIQDLTALSWAYFNCENDPLDIISYRLRALESVNLCERMNLALSMMIERRTKLVNLLRKNRIDSRNDDDEDDGLIMD